MDVADTAGASTANRKISFTTNRLRGTLLNLPETQSTNF